MVKHYKEGGLVRRQINDPLLDSKLAVEAFANQLKKLEDAPPKLLTAWHWLISRENGAGFDMVFSDIRGTSKPTLEGGEKYDARRNNVLGNYDIRLLETLLTPMSSWTTKLIPLVRLLRQALRETLPSATFVDISTTMMKQRLIKSQEEIALARKGAEICRVAVRAGEDAIAEGATEVDVAIAAELKAAEEHVRMFPDIEFASGQARCKSGNRSLMGHTPASGKKLVRGEVIQFGTNHYALGYHHTLHRQRTIGPVPKEIKQRFDVRLEAALTAIDAIKPGVLCSEIDRIAYRVFEKAGYVDFKGFGTGHSFGLFGPFWGREELGELRIYNHTPMEEGMILSVEPSLYFPDLGGLMTVDMVLVTKDGHEVLTDYPRELTSV